MANRYPLILNAAAGQLQELPTGDSLDLGGENILGVGNLTVGGDFTVSGTTTNINTVNLLVEDKNIVIGDVASPTNTTADGGGITLKGVTDKTINWVNATNAWTFSEHISIASAKEYRIAGTKVLDATGLGSGVVGSSLTSVGTIATGVWNGSVIGKAYLDATVVSTGDTGTVTSTMILNGTVLDADINASAGIVDTKLDTIATAGKVSNSATTATSANTASAIVARDGSNNFTAGTITAALTGAASSNVLKAGDTMTGALVVPLGAFGTPSLTFTGDLNTGIYSPGADQLAVATNGTGRLFVDASGNVGIGAAPNVKAEVSGSEAIVSLRVNTSNTGVSAGNYSQIQLADTGTIRSYWRNVRDGTGSTQFAYNDHLAFFSDAGGTPAERLRITSTGALNFVGAGTAGSTQAVSFNGSAPINSMVLNSSGQLGIGVSAPQAKLHIADSTGSAVELLRLETAWNSPSGNKSLTWTDGTNLLGRISVDYTSPTAKMRFGSLYSGGYQNSDLMTLTPTGLGIGTTSPTQLLSLVGTSANILLSGTSNSYTTYNISASNVGYVGDANWMFGGSSSDFGVRATSNLVFGIGADERARIRSDGMFEVKGAGTAGSSPAFSVNGSAPANSFVINSSGRLGIGTSTPSENLDVYAGSLTVGSHYVTTVNTNYKIRLRSVGPNNNNNYTCEIGLDGSGPQPADSDITFGTQTWNGSTYVVTEKARLTATGRLGIGTTGPQGKLESATGDSTDYAIVANSSYSSGDQNYISFRALTTQIGSINRITNTNDIAIKSFYDGIVFWTGTGGTATQKAKIDSSGRLLVGTTSAPTVGDSQYGLIRIQGNTSSASGFGLFSIGRGQAPASISANSELGHIYFTGNNGSPYASVSAYSDAAGGTNDYPGRLVFSTTADGAASPTERMRITSGGAVRIGSAISITPYDSLSSGTLSFEGSAGQLFSITNNLTTGSIFSVNDVSGIPSIDVNAAGTISLGAYGGNVGIGTTGPAEKLDVVGNIRITGNQSLIFQQTSGVAVGTVSFKNSAGVQKAAIASYYNVADEGAIEFVGPTNGTNVIIRSDGKMGIGTTGPSSLLHLVSSGQPTITVADNAGRTLQIKAPDGSGNPGFVGTTTNHDLLLQAGIGADGLNSMRFNTAGFERARIRFDGMFEVKGAGTAGSSPAFSVNGSAPANSFVIDSSGRLGIGTSSPQEKLHIALTGSATTPIINVGSFGTAGSVTLGSITNNSEHVYLGTGNSSGGGIAAGIGFMREAAGWNSALSFYTNNVTSGPNGVSAIQEKMRIDSSGRLLVGTTSAPSFTSGVRLVPNGTSEFLTDGNNNTPLRVGSTNDIELDLILFHGATATAGGSISMTSATSVAYNTSSDYRLKENVTSTKDSIIRLQQLKPKRFNFIGDPNRIFDGFLAHEVQEIVPESITGKKDAVDKDGVPKYQGIDQSKLVPLLTAALQEAIAKIEALETRLSALEAA